MADDVERLHARVEALHERLAEAGNVSADLRKELDGLLADVDQHLESQMEEDDSLTERLVEAGQHFESAHPTLGRTLSNLADLLSRMGI